MQFRTQNAIAVLKMNQNDTHLIPSTATHLLFSNAFTVVSLANELTKFTISAKMEGRRNCEAISAEHC